MSRPLRGIVPGFPYHLSQRGNNKQDIFRSEDDRRNYLYWFEDARQKWGMKVFAYCLMDNHVHFVAMADKEDSFARVIRAAHTRYAIYFNQKYGNVGHLWQVRYYSGLLKERHFIAALRYVERNPVRAGLTCKPWDWAWSSSKAHLGMEKSIIYLEDIRQYFDPPSWREFIDQPDNKEEVNELRGQLPARGRPKKKVPITFFC